MHKYITLFFSAALILCACNSKSIPGDVLKPDAMAGVLTEMHIIDGSLYNVMQAPDSLYKYGAGKYVAMFQRLHTDTAHFNKSMRYYATQPDKLLAIYDQVDISIKNKTDSVNKVQLEQSKAAHKADSLKNLNIKTKADSAKKVVPHENAAARKADSLDNLKTKAYLEKKLHRHKNKKSKKAKPLTNPNI
ncbi:DUF4296 domain-containing protein [Mucilaginibacter sp. SMC90]|uniref:DUF4296 domain-containing protein n=1 Tax=Mucilaginibacter sp. SMC90 TaxID=2929803 RepID=UPI001FB2D743|nr:DUF4296 domain-containing protein [Mucilaginibacter sp. SMC90]UOE47103.1 DUF4296 domain-containing protein [Mucilaginibacter sp. SMC90]